MRFKLSLTDHALQRQSRDAQRKWERALRAMTYGAPLGAAAGPSRAAAAGLGATRAFRRSEPTASSLRGVRASVTAYLLALNQAFGNTLSGIALPRLVAGSPVRRLVLMAAGASIAGVAVAATTAITKGYIEHPERFWSERIAERTQSPIYGRDNTLIGSVGALRGTLTPDDAREYAFIRVQGELPGVYQQALLQMENKNYFAGGLHNLCGLDIATLKRWLVSAGAGGSTLSMQLARALMQPDLGNEDYFFQKVWRKWREIGASCQLATALKRQGGDMALLKMYASYAPTFQGNGTLRGIEAASRIVFDVAPKDLTDAQQLILAAAARKPLTLLPPGATDIACRRLYPRNENPDYEPETAKANVARAVQCQILHRAIFRAPDVLAGDRLDAAMADLRQYQVKGLHPANPFEPIPARKLVNLASRTAAAMPKGLLAKIRQEVDEDSIAIGEPLYVGLDAVRQHEFQGHMTQALDRIQRTPAMRKTLCLPLVSDAGMPVSLPRCGAEQDGVKSADVLAIKVDVTTGGLKALYASSPLILDSRQSIGSTAKLVVIAAALAHGHLPDELLCPKAARDGDRALKRVALPADGFQNCEGGRHLMTWAHATATSDNLAYYELSQKLGTRRLASAATALSLGDPASSHNLAYELSFGAYGARPRDLISATQALVAVAYGIKTTGHAPRALSNPSEGGNPSIAALETLLPKQTQRDALRQLLEAPVQGAGGTLAFLKGKVTAGKTGTVQSVVKAPGGRNYNHGKWSVTYQQQNNTLNLFFVASPLPTVPLAQHDLGARALMPAHLQILNLE